MLLQEDGPQSGQYCENLEALEILNENVSL